MPTSPVGERLWLLWEKRAHNAVAPPKHQALRLNKGNGRLSQRSSFVVNCDCRVPKFQSFLQQKCRNDRTRGITELSSGALCVQERLAAAGLAEIARVAARRRRRRRFFFFFSPPPARAAQKNRRGVRAASRGEGAPARASQAKAPVVCLPRARRPQCAQAVGCVIAGGAVAPHGVQSLAQGRCALARV